MKRKILMLGTMLLTSLSSLSAEKNLPYYSVIDVTITNKNWGVDYRSNVTPLVNEYGGTYLVQGSNYEQLEGKQKSPSVLVVIKWPSKEAAQKFMQDPRYAPYLKARTDNSISNHYLVEGLR